MWTIRTKVMTHPLADPVHFIIPRVAKMARNAFFAIFARLGRRSEGKNSDARQAEVLDIDGQLNRAAEVSMVPKLRLAVLRFVTSLLRLEWALLP